MQAFWDDRYGTDGYAYGTEPNQYFKDTLDRYKAGGKILLPAEGEGRNAVFAASKGYEVFAFDISVEGKKKAEKLANEHGVTISYEIGNLPDLKYRPQHFDVIALIFAHFPPNLLSSYHKTFIELLKPGGLMILEGFSKSHLELQEKNPQVGGPKNIDMLFSVASIRADFQGFEIFKLEEKQIVLSEGPFHQGLSSVIRFIGKKPL